MNSKLFLFIGCIGILFSSSQAQTVRLDSGLVAFYPFEGNTQDHTKNGHDGTAIDMTIVPGRCGEPNSAYSFNGSSSSLEIPDKEDLSPSQISIALWVKLYSSKGAMVAAKAGNDAYNEQFALAYYPFQDGNPEYLGFHFSIKDSGSCANPGKGWEETNSYQEVPLQEWHFVTATFNGTYCSLFLDGKLLFTKQLPISSISKCTGGNLRFGRWYNEASNHLSGELDDIRIYNRALALNEIRALFTHCIVTNNDVEGDVSKNVLCSISTNQEHPGHYEIKNGFHTYIRSELINLQGVLVKELTIQPGVTELNLENYPQGIYLLKTPTQTMKIVK